MYQKEDTGCGILYGVLLDLAYKLKKLAEKEMEEKHWTEWVESIADGKTYRQYLNPGEVPEAIFNETADQITAREYCNIHGLWKA